MNKTWKAALAASLLMGTAHAARADLTINGAVGLPLNPTAQIPLPGGVRVQGNYFQAGTLTSGGGVNLADVSFYGLHAAGRVANRIEVNGGIERVRVSDKFVQGAFSPIGKTGVALGVKYLFSRETDPVGVRTAAGIGYSSAIGKDIYVYVVGSKTLGAVSQGRVPSTGHLGLRYDRFTLPNTGILNPANGLVVGGGRSSKASVYAGVEVPFTHDGSFAFVGELQSKNNKAFSATTPYSASLRYRPAGQGFSASIGVARQGIVNDKGLFIQLGYTFDRGIDQSESSPTNSTGTSISAP